MLVHRRVTPSSKFVCTHLYTWVERGTMRVKYLAQEHNTVPRPGLEPGVQGSDPESSALTIRPPRLPCSHTCKFKRRPSLQIWCRCRGKRLNENLLNNTISFRRPACIKLSNMDSKLYANDRECFKEHEESLTFIFQIHLDNTAIVLLRSCSRKYRCCSITLS